MEGAKMTESNLKEQCAPYNMHGNQPRLYVIWNKMKQRCGNPNAVDFSYYGGRGIAVCDQWKKSFWDFRAWALVNGYADNLTIDRIDNDGNYEPNNCRWISFAEQRTNTSQTRKVTINGETMCLKHWCEKYGINYAMVCQRIHRGMNEVDALLTPQKRRKSGWTD